MTNFIAGRNPFNLPAPKAWWLKVLFDYDAQLVILPSAKDCVYRLCRRVRRGARLGLSQMTIHEHPDTVQMIQHGLVPIATLTPWSIQADVSKVIRDLQARDLWKAGGGPGQGLKVATDLEYREVTAEADAEMKRAQALDHVSGEAYQSLLFRKGSKLSQARTLVR